MSEYRFDVREISHSLKEQGVRIDFSLDLDEDTINLDNVILAVLDKGAQRMVPFELLVDGGTLFLKLNEWAVPNQRYTLLIQPGIESITGDKLDHAVMRNFTFPSEVTSEVNIKSPGDFERVKEAKFTWEETGDKKIGSFYLEIAKDSAFYDIVLRANTGEPSYETELKENGQYFLRIRAQAGVDSYGHWSDKKTFLLENTCSCECPDCPDNKESTSGDVTTGDKPDGPIVIEDDTDPKLLTLITKPENGITPPHFDFVFDNDIDITDATVEIVRSDF